MLAALMYDTLKDQPVDSLGVDELQLLRLHKTTLPADVPGKPRVCRRMCTRWAEAQLRSDLVCA